MNTYSVNEPKYTKQNIETINRGCLNFVIEFERAWVLVQKLGPGWSGVESCLNSFQGLDIARTPG